MSGPNRDLEVKKAREKEMELLDEICEISPEVLRNLPESFQRVVAMLRRVRDRQKEETS